MRPDYDFVVWATYGLGPSRGLIQVGEVSGGGKDPDSVAGTVARRSRWWWWMDRLPPSILMAVRSARCGARPRHSNHWTTTDPNEPVPGAVTRAAEWPGFGPIALTDSKRCDKDAALAVPASAEAVYLGSRFTIRVVENNPAAGSPDVIRAGDGAGRNSHFLRQSGQRGESRTDCLRENRRNAAIRFRESDVRPVVNAPR